MRKFLICFTALFISLSLFAQQDTATLDVEQVLQLVRQYHPLVKQAEINIDMADAEILRARGAFNPLINNYIASKTLDNTNYYNYLSPSVTIPTWYGIEINAGLEELTGDRLSDADTRGKTSYLGATVPLLKNLIIDKRRAYLQQAKLFKEMSYTEQRVVVNNILFDAAATYWEWANAYQAFKIIEQNLKISTDRFILIKKTVEFGERPAIDTVEALTQLQFFEFLRNDAFLEFQNKGIELSLFLWRDNNEAYLLPEWVTPTLSWNNETNIQNFNLLLLDLLATAQRQHPELIIYNQKLQILEVDRRLKFQELLPKLDFTYNRLSKGYNVLGAKGALFDNNYQYGLKLQFPLWFSEGRGAYRQAKLKITENEILQSEKRFMIETKLRNYFNDFLMLKKQIALQSATLLNYHRLLRAEETLFLNGESSLFLINARENKVLETERKLTELKTKYYKTVYALQWSSGVLL